MFTNLANELGPRPVEIRMDLIWFHLQKIGFHLKDDRFSMEISMVRGSYRPSYSTTGHPVGFWYTNEF